LIFPPKKNELNRNVFLLFYILAFSFLQLTVKGQVGNDSLLINDRLGFLEKKTDSLEKALRDARSRMVTHSQFEGILRSINEDDQEFTDDGRRSKRRALDSLFKVAVSRPKQLTFTEQFPNDSDLL